jgi:hypothetical protein
MKCNFNKQVANMQRKEVLSLYKQLAEQNEPFYQEVEKEGYAGLHCYEADVMQGLAKRILITVILIITLITIFNI